MPEIWETWCNVTRMTWPELKQHATDLAMLTDLSRVKMGKRYTVWLHLGGACFVTAFNEGHAHGVDFIANVLPGLPAPE